MFKTERSTDLDDFSNVSIKFYAKFHTGFNLR